MVNRATQDQTERASVPAFGGWEAMAAAAGGGAGAIPDYSLDFSKIRAARMQRRKAMSWSGVADGAGAGEEQQSSTAAGGGSEDRERRRSHRRQHSDAIEDRQPIRPGGGLPPKGRGKFRGYFFGCMGRW